jgi:cysteinyl-tRNA synthetase
LCDNIDTYTVMEGMRDLVATAHAYIKQRSPHPNALLLHNTVEYMTRLLRMFGAIESSAELGFPSISTSVGGEALLQPYLECLRNFRGVVRTAAQSVKATQVLVECDRLRDDILPELGVRLEDQANAAAIIKLDNKENLLREREQRQRIEAEKRAATEARQRQAEETAAKNEALMKIKPDDLFRLEPDAASKYSKYDASGIPTHDAAGEELSKKQRKKLEKLHETHTEKYNKANVK